MNQNLKNRYYYKTYRAVFGRHSYLRHLRWQWYSTIPLNSGGGMEITTSDLPKTQMMLVELFDWHRIGFVSALTVTWFYRNRNMDVKMEGEAANRCAWGTLQTGPL